MKREENKKEIYCNPHTALKKVLEVVLLHRQVSTSHKKVKSNRKVRQHYFGRKSMTCFYSSYLRLLSFNLNKYISR